MTQAQKCDLEHKKAVTEGAKSLVEGNLLGNSQASRDLGQVMRAECAMEERQAARMAEIEAGLGYSA